MKLHYLDGMRGLAALVVLCAHFRDLLLPSILRDDHLSFSRLAETPVMLIVAGNAAVRLFFLHSGFVLAWKYLHTGEPAVLISMAARRVFRLGIPIAVSILLAFVLMRSGAMTNSQLSHLVRGSSPLASHYLFAPTTATALYDAFGGWFFSKSFRYNGSLWTMPVELTASYLVFLISPAVLYIRKRFVLATGLAMSAALLLTSAAVFAYFVIGVILARFWSSPEWSASIRRSGSPSRRSLFAVLMACTMTAAVWPHWIASAVAAKTGLHIPELFQLPAISILFAGLLISTRAQRFFSLRPLHYLGRTSFFAFLLHLPLICSFSGAVFIYLSSLQMSYSLRVALTFFPTLLLIYGLADLMSRTVDRYAINFGKAFINQHLRNRTGEPAAAPP